MVVGMVANVAQDAKLRKFVILGCIGEQFNPDKSRKTEKGAVLSASMTKSRNTEKGQKRKKSPLIWQKSHV